ncbi:hypothetical protein K7432_000769 [Basidiobolus ranarum]|uniref:Myb-like DNA-binding domain containing protein n=1 Tax=Basidiobolus ranarum TaxID=34480 RepID=A0ABR2WAS5_9FUNG
MLFTQLSIRNTFRLLTLTSNRQIFGKRPIYTFKTPREIYSLELQSNLQRLRHTSYLLHTCISFDSPSNHFILKRSLNNQSTENSHNELLSTQDPKEKPLFLQWTTEEIDTLKKYAPVYRYNWNKVAVHIPTRTASACRYYWKKLKLKPYITGPWTIEEDEVLKKLIEEEGSMNHWHKFAKVLGRKPRDCLSRVKHIFHTQM